MSCGHLSGKGTRGLPWRILLAVRNGMSPPCLVEVRDADGSLVWLYSLKSTSTQTEYVEDDIIRDNDEVLVDEPGSAFLRTGEIQPFASNSGYDELTADLKTNPQREPVRCLPDGRVYLGNTRVEILKSLPLPVEYVIDDITEDEAWTRAYIDGLARRNLSKAERDAAVRGLHERTGMTQEALSKVFGISQQTISRALNPR